MNNDLNNQPPSIAALADQAIGAAQALRHLPESTYRLQLHKDFTFRRAIAIVPYLAELGMSHVYASSYLRAVAGSTHGYDVIDHTRLNPEIGSEADYEEFIATLKKNGLAHILDTVPNHVGVGTNENAWWNDVLENGPAAEHAPYFDIAWQPAMRPELKDKVLLPGLGTSYGEALDKGELKLVLDSEAGRLFVKYFDRRFPIAPETYATVFDFSQGVLRGITEKNQIAELCRQNASAKDAIEQVVDRFNDSNNTDALHRLLEQQHYRLASWRVGPEEINYRRFFAINDLAALAMERQDVFEAAHSFILPRLADGTIAGLRIDHPDGLSDPLQYFRRLQSHFVLACAKRDFAGTDAEWEATCSTLLAEIESRVAGGDPAAWPLYVVIEKILAIGETLPPTWPTNGTSGYDFLDMANALMIDTTAEQAMTNIYHDFIGPQPAYDELVFNNKKMVLRQLLPSELHRLAYLLDRIAQRHRATRDFTITGLAAALGDVIAAFPLYRTYITGPDISREDSAALRRAIDAAIARNPATPRDIFEFIHNTLKQQHTGPATDADRSAVREFARKFQQLTAPATAKGIEDTTFYQYQRLISLNEVGYEPSKFGMTGDEVHAYFTARVERWPHALSTLSTHDTKRSEDVRARISVLADVPHEWGAAVKEWLALNTPYRHDNDGLSSPARDEEYCYYQTLLGAWPIECEGAAASAEFIERVQAFMLKANREANVRTGWSAPNEAHESAVKEFVAATLDPKKSPSFHASFLPFQAKIAHFGRLASLSQTMLKLAAPGAADTYQGTELWDLSLVDPDNRRPVDYARREAGLRAVRAVEHAAQVADLFDNTADGLAKLFLHHRVLGLRKMHAGLFTTGTYTPLAVHGPAASHIFAFARTHQKVSAIVILTKNLAKLCGFDPERKIDGALLGNTSIDLPSGLQNWTDVLHGDEQMSVGRIAVADLLRGLPVALLIGEHS